MCGVIGCVCVVQNVSILVGIEVCYGVLCEIVVVVWGMELNFGVNWGSICIVFVLVMLVYDGWCGEFFVVELVVVLCIIQLGDVDNVYMVGSWVGVMGYIQFMFSFFFVYVVDFIGDGWCDIWLNDLIDVLVLIVYYLCQMGW